MRQNTKEVIGRDEEKEKLNEILCSKGADFVAIYGRRRVGKTYLIRNYLKPNIVFDYTGTKDGTLQEQLNNFFEEYLKQTKTKKKIAPPTTWQEAFKYLATYLNSLKKGKLKHVVFIDEMPWLDQPKSNFVSALEYFWNQYASAMDHVVLIACGSASSWIKRKLINARGGLYNRITHRIKLNPFNLYETSLYIKSMGVQLTQYQTIELYMAMGGIPFYIKEIKKGKSVMQLIDEICFSNKGLLHEEYHQLYHSLFKNADFHIKIIEALANRPQGMTRAEIALKSKISEATLNRTLEELVECDFVSNYMPLLNKKKTAIYKLTDLYSLFYLKFIKPNKKGGRGTWKQLQNQAIYKAWSGYAFENICMLHINQIKKALGINGIYSKTSSWVFKGNETLPGAQIDMLIDRADDCINICEAKFTNDHFVINKNYANQLRMKKTIFKQSTLSKKNIFNTLLTTYPALKNQYYLSEIDNEVSMNKLFEPNDA